MAEIRHARLSSIFLLLFFCSYIASTAQPTAPSGKKLIARERLASMVHYHGSSWDTRLWNPGDSIVFTWSGENCSQQFNIQFPDIHISCYQFNTKTIYSHSVPAYTEVMQYNNEGRPDGSFYGKWNNSQGKWDTIFVCRLNYDNQSRLTDSTISYFDNSTLSLRDSLKIQYSYPEHDTVRIKMIMNNGSWENVTREISTTDLWDRIIKKTWAYWDKSRGAWLINTNDSFTYIGTRRFIHLQQYIQHNPDTAINSTRTHYIYYSGRPFPEVDSVERWSRTKNKWYTSGIKQRQFSNGLLVKQFNCVRDTIHNKLDTGSNLYYSAYKDTSVVEYGDMYWDRTSGRFMRYAYINLLECDSMGMITQIKSCRVYANDSLEAKEMIVYHYEKFYVTVDEPQAPFTDIQLYPNPSTNKLQPQLRIPMDGTHKVSIVVHDMLGHQLLTDHFEHQDTYEGFLPSGAWPPGTYLVSVSVDGVLKSTMKLIK